MQSAVSRFLKVVSPVVMLLGLIDAPGQAQKWFALLSRMAGDAPQWLAGDGGRWTLVGVGLLLTLVAYDVPQRLMQRVSLPGRPQGLGADTILTVVTTSAALSSNRGLSYPLKLRVELRAHTAVTVSNLRWIRGPEGWPPIVPSPIKIKQPNSKEDLDAISVTAGQSIHVWVGMDDSTVHLSEVNRRLTEQRTGVLACDVERDGRTREVRVGL
jgi:hypothetical protein